ncbi:hypothetical protein IWW36_003379, partial [Coemansia brasiliensis]
MDLVTFWFIDEDINDEKKVSYTREKELKEDTIGSCNPKCAVVHATMAICYDESKTELARYEESEFETALFDVYEKCGQDKIYIVYGHEVNMQISVKTGDEVEVTEAKCYSCQT